jgi:hypothetical protein
VGSALAAELAKMATPIRGGEVKVEAVTGSQRRGTYGLEVAAYQVDGAATEAARRGMALSPWEKIYRTTDNGDRVAKTQEQGNATAQRAARLSPPVNCATTLGARGIHGEFMRVWGKEETDDTPVPQSSEATWAWLRA